MAILLGIDLGTSSVKAILITETGRMIGSANLDYPVSFTADGGAEQDADMWWGAVCNVLGRLRENNRQEYDAISAIGFSGRCTGWCAWTTTTVRCCPR